MPSSHTMTTRRPIGDVFRFLSAPEHLAAWDGAVRWARWSAGGPLGVGATFAQAIARDGRTEVAAGEVVAYEPPHELGWRSDLGGVRTITRITLEAVGMGTRLRLRRHGLREGVADREELARVEVTLRRLRDVLEGQRPC
jgi:uncharacterized protein YndB with AHSA1/START domain